MHALGCVISSPSLTILQIYNFYYILGGRSCQGIDERGELYVTRGSGGMSPNFLWYFRALRELLGQSEAKNYSTAIAFTDMMLWLTCCMKIKCV